MINYMTHVINCTILYHLCRTSSEADPSLGDCVEGVVWGRDYNLTTFLPDEGGVPVWGPTRLNSVLPADWPRAP